MGKNDFLTPKAIANRIKAKGLQKLRWYCQMCQKQCRDENGFKCHCLSEGHQRQMLIFGQNQSRVVGGFSEEFEATFLDLIRRSHRSSRVAATVVYNEYIADRHHVHMNSTRWATLTEFIKHLGRKGLCKVDETPKGWFLTYIDRDSPQALQDRLKERRARADLAEEEKHDRDLLRQIQRASSSSSSIPASTEERKEVDLDKTVRVGFALGQSRPLRPEALPGVFQDEEKDENNSRKKQKSSSALEEVMREEGRKQKSASALEEVMREEERKKERDNRRDYWVCEGIVVKVMSKALAPRGYYKHKGVVRRVVDKYVAEIEMLESKHVLRVDQQELETVIPGIGGALRILNGAYRGCHATLLSVDTNNFCAKIQIQNGIYDGRVIDAIEYEDICKIA